MSTSHAHSTTTGQGSGPSSGAAAPPEVVTEAVIQRHIREEYAKQPATCPPPAYPPGQSVNFYRELVYAGFPHLQPHPSAYKGMPGGAKEVADTVVYSDVTVRNFFSKYGPLANLRHDRLRGIGCVCFQRGEDAESCFLALNNSIIPSPMGDPSIKGPQEVTEPGDCTFGGLSGTREGVVNRYQGRVKDYVITCEFARCLPFVSSFMLLKDEYGSLELSRSLLRNFPVPESAAVGELGGFPSVVYFQANIAKKEEGSSGGGSGAAAPPAGNNTALIAIPSFADAEVDPAHPVVRSMWRVLRPEALKAPRPNLCLTVLDLWWEYYNTYMVHKTEPTPDRIRNKREFLAASLATITQEVIGLKDDSSSRNTRATEASPGSLLRRLVFDDVYHSTLNAILMKQQFKLDPAFASFMRDVYTEQTIRDASRYLTSTHPAYTVEALRLQRLIEKVVTRADRGNDAAGAKARARCFTSTDAALAGKGLSLASAGDDTAAAAGTASSAPSSLTQKETDAKEDMRADIAYSVHPKVQQWLALPMLEVASNVIANVQFLRHVRQGHVAMDGTVRQTRKKSEEEEEMGYPSKTLAQEDADLYDEILTNLNGFCADGSLFSLLLLGEDPAAFRSQPSHLGYEELAEYHNKHNRRFWRLCGQYAKALAVPVVLLTCLVLVICYVTAPDPAEKTARAWGTTPVTPTLEARGDGAKERRPTHGTYHKPITRPTTTTTTTTTTATTTHAAGGDGSARKKKDAVEGGRGHDEKPARTQPPTPAELQEMMEEFRNMDPETLAETRREAARRAREMMEKAKEEAAKRGAKFNVGFSADL